MALFSAELNKILCGRNWDLFIFPRNYKSSRQQTWNVFSVFVYFQDRSFQKHRNDTLIMNIRRIGYAALVSLGRQSNGILMYKPGMTLSLVVAQSSLENIFFNISYIVLRILHNYLSLELISSNFRVFQSFVTNRII